MNKINNIKIKEMQYAGINSYAVIQQLVDHISDTAENGTTIDDEYKYLRDMFSDEAICYEVKR